uniref:Transposase Tc1-like domain-containing protein n=1 Tax=Oryzias latipes TaxID=8090 RepID=A0A3P9I9K5_ORYLA
KPRNPRLQVGSRRSDVAGGLGKSQSVIRRLASRCRTTGRVCDRPRSGALSVTDHNHDQNLRSSDLRHDVRGTGVSRLTIPNQLHRFDWNARRPLQWTHNHVTWTMQQWSTVLFTGEVWVTVHRNDGRQSC